MREFKLFYAIIIFSTLIGCSKPKPITEEFELDAGRYPVGDTMGIWESITKTGCADKARAKYPKSKNVEVLSFETVPNPPRVVERGTSKQNEYDSVTCTVTMTF